MREFASKRANLGKALQLATLIIFSVANSPMNLNKQKPQQQHAGAFYRFLLICKIIYNKIIQNNCLKIWIIQKFELHL